MGCHFIKQEDGTASGLLGDKVGMGQHNPEQQCLLFAR
jgi:hypothetical protein